MSYVIEYMNGNDEIKYYLTDSAGVYCPELATRYSSRKSAITAAEGIKKKNNYRFLRVIELSYDLISIAHHRYCAIADNILYPDNYR